MEKENAANLTNFKIWVRMHGFLLTPSEHVREFSM
jgi:hypothetical protein